MLEDMGVVSTGVLCSILVWGGCEIHTAAPVSAATFVIRNTSVASSVSFCGVCTFRLRKYLAQDDPQAAPLKQR